METYYDGERDGFRTGDEPHTHAAIKIDARRGTVRNAWDYRVRSANTFVKSQERNQANFDFPPISRSHLAREERPIAANRSECSFSGFWYLLVWRLSCAGRGLSMEYSRISGYDDIATRMNFEDDGLNGIFCVIAELDEWVWSGFGLLW
ncbi:uncharacterized protein RAG0_13276 [Rhynchosporium agropyri]|uniref:Uncharacterized protein n=1 Tax=Rhynchosporium agropyri TaxID=914238 RepID=A0A1E1LC41_9HELO|nr:uncharacterized protein RAG0_13276 [Rhynchosporium agropyri]